MSTPTTQPSATEATCYRLVVRSAAEAVAVVRERFGSSARVLSVRQIEAGGLARFLQKPRLEVIVEVSPAASPGQAPASNAPAEPEVPVREPAVAEAPSREDSGAEAEADPAARVAPDVAEFSSEARGPSRSAASLLRATGLDDVLLERIRADEPAIDDPATPPTEVLTRLAAWLRRRYGEIPRRPVGVRRVFLGSCGTGKTTALCKLLALDVFVRGRQPAVLKLDGEQPNASDGLAAFCDVLGAPLLRSASEVEEFDPEHLLYIDVPGVGLDAGAEHRRLASALDGLHVDTRVLVVNAACESEVIAAAYEMGRACGATHVIFTHFDEVRRPARLWRFVLHGGLRPLLLSSGPSPAGEGEEDVFSGLLERTFPPGLARSAGTKEGRGRT